MPTNNQDWTKPSPGVKISIKVSHVGQHLLHSRKQIIRKLESGGELGLESRHSNTLTGHPTRCLNCCTKYQPLHCCLKIRSSENLLGSLSHFFQTIIHRQEKHCITVSGEEHGIFLPKIVRRPPTDSLLESLSFEHIQSQVFGFFFFLTQLSLCIRPLLRQSRIGLFWQPPNNKLNKPGPKKTNTDPHICQIWIL